MKKGGLFKGSDFQGQRGKCKRDKEEMKAKHLTRTRERILIVLNSKTFIVVFVTRFSLFHPNEIHFVTILNC